MQIINNPTIKEHYVRLLDTRFSNNFTCDFVEFQSGQLIFRQGEELNNLYFLMRGKVKIYSTSVEGKRLIVAFNRPIQLFGDIELVQKSSILNSIEAVGTVHLLRFSKNEANRLRLKTPFNDYLLELISRKFYTKSQVLSFHLLYEASTRFASYLISISHNELGQFIEPLVKKKELYEIAEFIGITARHQNRIIQKFMEENILQRTNEGVLIVDPLLLKQKAADNIYEMQ